MSKGRHRFRQSVRQFRCRVKRRALRQTTVLAITGSCGKTTTTKFLGKILSDHADSFVGIHENDVNSIMRNIRDVRWGHRFLVQEVSGDCPGKMDSVLPLLKPDIGIVTTIGQDHYRNFRTLEATAREKGALIEFLSASGVAVLNADDPHVLAMKDRSRARVITYGLCADADVCATDMDAAWPKRLSMTVSYQGASVRVETALFGKILSNSILAAIAGGLAAGVGLEQCAESLKGIETFPRRMSIHRTAAGAWVVNDAGKAPFWSVQGFVSQLSAVSAPRKTLVLGTFSDTPGSDSDKYRMVAREALSVADRVIFVGSKATHVRKRISPKNASRLFVIESVEESADFLKHDVVQDEVILIKSGNRDHLERLIYGQDAGLTCWKQSCPKMMSCAQCEASGLLGFV